MKRLLSAMYESRTCASGTNVAGCGSLFRPPSRVSPTIPMISRGALREIRPHAGADDQPLPDRIFVFPVPPRHRLVDHALPAGRRRRVP